MKKFYLLFFVALSQIVFAQKADYIIPYGKGVDTVYANIGDTIGASTFAFYEKEDQFYRDDGADGVITFSSHGNQFFGTDMQMYEDTLEGYIVVTKLVLCASPETQLFAAKDERTLGDTREPESSSYLGFLLLFIGSMLLLIFKIRWSTIRKKLRF